MEAKLYRRSRDKLVCQLCWHFCKLSDGEHGKCRVRYVKDGKMYTKTYGKLSYLESRPIEIKPFYHFLPGSTSMTFSSYSCNFSCPWCQNWSISKSLPDGDFFKPEEVVKAATAFGDESTCASLNEPTLLFEYLLEVFKLARNEGLLNTMVSNGYMSILALKELKKHGLDALKVDVKGDSLAYSLAEGKVEFVWKVIKEANKLGIHLEVVCLLVTGVSDSLEIVKKNVETLSEINAEIPIHFTRYFPAYKFKAPPTKIEILEKAVEIAKKELSYAYIGNVPGHKYENTYCPDCGEVLIRRYHVRVFENKIENRSCPRCGREIYGIFK
ncbi:MAG: radical SAM protein [Archaeoglobaceae archaeon]|nr:radical SAM protein [Archaeoglobaceae archaeon]MCX8151436.1 radical SAM protein [Archaeoglobaceae archaeon]MDW8014198.1 radical SAM protein [Archaeoglobaceae archaeon]